MREISDERKNPKILEITYCLVTMTTIQIIFHKVTWYSPTSQTCLLFKKTLVDRL